MLTLAIDTTTVVCVGIARDQQVLTTAALGDTRSHVELLAAAVQTQVAQAGLELADLDRIVVGTGPAPFTGLRVGITTARTLGAVLNIPVRGVCSLDVLAAQWAATGATDEFLTMVDARRKELYWAQYDRTGTRIGPLSVSPPEDVPALGAYGPAAALYPERFGGWVLGAVPLDAGFLAAHADQIPEAGLAALYLRQPDAELPKTRKSTLGHLRIPNGPLS